MKEIFSLCFACLFATVVEAAGPTSVTQSRDLLNLFKTMGEIADNGPMMSFFGFSENPSHLPVENCKNVDVMEVELYIKGLLREMDWATQGQKDSISKSIKTAMFDLRMLLESDLVERCEDQFSEYMTWTRIVSFRSRSSRYQITFTEGYED